MELDDYQKKAVHAKLVLLVACICVSISLLEERRMNTQKPIWPPSRGRLLTAFSQATRGGGLFCLEADMRTIPLTRGFVAIVDEDDFERVNQFKWCADKTSNTWYAHRGQSIGNGKIRHIKMHRFILGLETGAGGIVDHINGDGLDNCKCNLRLCSHSDNIQRGPHRPNRVGFLGVRGPVQDCPLRPYRSRASNDGKRKDIGHFKTAEEAARSYDRFVVGLHGIHARTNFPVSDYIQT